MRYTTAAIFSVAVSVAAGGCATPQAVKDASTVQLQLIASLDSAAQSLSNGLEQFADDQDALIRQERRITIATAAITDATSGIPAGQAVGFDRVFDLSNAKLLPAIDMTLYDPAELDDLPERIAALDKTVGALPDGSKDANGTDKDTLLVERDKLKLMQARYATLSVAVRAQENEEKTALELNGNLHDKVAQSVTVLRDQIAVMAVLATQVDAWLKIDVSPTQQQVDGVDATYSALITKLGAKH